MNTKEKVYQHLLNTNEAVSGETMAEKFQVSRTAIWKAIQFLKSEGHEILSKQKEGYILLSESSEFNKSSIMNYLKVEMPIHLYDTLESTNTTAKRLAEDGHDETLIIAKTQTKGRGRFERTFYSPLGGLYMSFIIRPTSSCFKTTHITMISALAVCRAIQEFTECELTIKWVNDIFYKKKKVAGILTEASIDFETRHYNYFVIGIGLNLILNEIPAEYREVISDIQFNADKNKLVASIINNFYDYFDMPLDVIVDEYRSLSMLIGKTVIVQGEDKEAKVLDITDEGHLLVEFNQGEIRALQSGEVSIKGLEDE